MTCTLGMGIMERLGGRAAMTLPPGVCERAWVGEKARGRKESSPSREVSESDVDIKWKWDLDGVGM